MDIKQVPTQNPVQPPPIVQQRNVTPWIIISLLLFALILTGFVYFLLPSSATKKQTNAAIHPPTAQTAKNQIPWTTYTDKQYGYWFHHPDAWKLTTDQVNPEKFILSNNANDQSGEIRGEFLSKEQLNKQGDFTCNPQKNEPTRPCYTFELAASSSAYLHVAIENNKPTRAQVFITRPDDKGLIFEITKPNADSYNVLSIIMATLQFPNEKRSKPLSICPDSWSADKKTVLYHGIIFLIEDVDEVWIRDNCK